MAKLLFLSHRIPFPPNKGDKIRSFHLLKHLSSSHDVYLGTFVDEPDDWKHVKSLRRFCKELHVVGLTPYRKRLASLSGLMTGRALSLPYFADKRLTEWVKRILRRENIDRIFTYSSPMAQYVMGGDSRHVLRVADFVDVDSEKWGAYARKAHWPMNRLYAREAKKLLDYEQRVAAEFDHTVFVSDAELSVFQQLAPHLSERTLCIENGVDTDYFMPDVAYSCPYGPREQALVFTGAMDYWANVDAVCWFARTIFPRIIDAIPAARFYIVGARPTSAVWELGRVEGVRVTGGVPDIRPYIAHAAAAVAPMRIARGVQNKVLEAMAMAKPVVATTAAMEGIRSGAGPMSFVSDTDDGLAQLAIQILTQGDTEERGPAARRHVERYYGWAGRGAQLDSLLSIVPQVRTVQRTTGNSLCEQLSDAL